jgi:hypothetical protein
LETVEEIVDRLQDAMNHIDADRLMVAPDFGLGFLDRELAVLTSQIIKLIFGQLKHKIFRESRYIPSNGLL